MGEKLVNYCDVFLRNCYVSRGLYLGGLKMFGEKNLGKCIMCIGIEVIPRLFCPDFSFSPVLTRAPLILFGKRNLNSKLQVRER